MKNQSGILSFFKPKPVQKETPTVTMASSPATFHTAPSTPIASPPQSLPPPAFDASELFSQSSAALRNADTVEDTSATTSKAGNVIAGASSYALFHFSKG